MLINNILILSFCFNICCGFNKIPVNNFGSLQILSSKKMLEDNNYKNITYFEEVKQQRFGRSNDQDGKTNIWSIEPKMFLQDESENVFPTNTKISIILTIGVIVLLKSLILFSSILPDPDSL
jgi:hypothetical protein